MFIRVKKIGAYEYLYLVENAREGAVTSSASSRHLAAATQSRAPTCSMA
jgi:hypothetical protein